MKPFNPNVRFPTIQRSLAVLLLGLASINARAATPLSGSQSGTLTAANSPYLATSDVVVNGGQTLTIEPGVVVQFQNSNHHLVIDGTLIAQGTVSAPILFTSDEIQKAPGQWGAIVFRGANTNSILENCAVEYAAAAGVADESIRFESASPKIRNCTISNSRLHGIRLFSSDPWIENCRFLNNGAGNKDAFAIMMRTDSLPRFNNNTAAGNGHDAIGIFDFNVGRNGTWMKDNLPYTLLNDIYVNSGAMLTIAAGVTVQFQTSDTALVVDGTLIARSTAATPILFTSAEAQKAPGQWEAIIFRGPNTNSILENCIVECGARLGVSDEAVRCESASPTIRNCTIRSSRMHGLSLFGSDPWIENCQFLNNGSTNKTAFAIRMRTDSLPRLNNNTATGNVCDAIGVFDFNVARKGIWPKDNLPYTLLNDIYVNSGASLTLAAGVTVQFQNPDTALVVDGTLLARSTTDKPILFTSDETQKAPGQWEAIVFRSTATNSILENCLVECGAAAGVSDESIRFEGATAIIRNCAIRNSRMHGISFYDSNPIIEECQFLNNGSTNANAFAMAMRIDSWPRLANNSARGNGNDAIAVFDYHAGRSGTWLKDNLPYTLLNDVYVDAGATLTLEPGLIVQFRNPDTALVIDGTISARGAVNAPIRFTSDDVEKAPGQWEAIIFRATSVNSILENCMVEYGAAAGVSDECIRFENATATIRNCTIRNSRLDGIRFQASDPVIENCQFVNNGATNGGFAMAMRVDSLPKLKGNLALGNGRDAIKVFDSNFGRSGTWVNDGLPYTLVNDVYVNVGKTLTLEPGLVVQFRNPDTALVVDGTISARGGVSAPIRFTSDDVEKAPGQWEAIIFRATSVNSILENCILEFAGAAGLSDEIVRFENATATIRSCTIRNSRIDGIRFQASDPVIENCQFVDNGATNGGFAMAMRVDSLPKLKGNLALGNGRDAIKVFDSNFGRNGNWVKDGLPYTLVNDVYVNVGKTLTIEAGVTVQFQDGNAGLWVDGALIARGTTAAPITFTSAALLKKPGQWRALTFRAPDGNSALENCNIEYGGANAEGNVALFGSSPRLNNCTVRNSLSDGLHCNNSASTITACRIVSNGRDGLRAVNGASPTINNSTIAGQGEFGVRNFDTARIINAKANFWGDPSGPIDNANTDGRNQLNANGKGDKVSEYVDWSSFLQTDPLTPIPAQRIEVAPASLEFGSVVIGQSQELFLTVRNTGGQDLSVTSVASDNSRFRIVSPATPFTVAPGLHQAIGVTFGADGTASATGALTLRSTDASQPTVIVSLKANGVVAGGCLAAPPGLVGWWPGDGSFLNLAGTNHGQPSGGVTFSSGKVGQAFSFANDSERITIPHDPLLDVQAPGFTVEFWMRGSKNQPHDQYLVVDKSHGWTDSTGWMCQGFSNDGRIFFGIGAGGGGNVNFPGVTSTTDLLDGIFHHVAGTWDGSTVRLYVDSVLQGETAHSAPANNTRPVNIGYSWGGGSPNRFLRGQVDELSIYRRALTTTEIQDVVAAGRVGKCRQAEPDGLIAHLPFDGNATDESGNGHHGIVNGAILTTDRFGHADRAYQFDGQTQFIELANSKALNFSSGGFTLSAWIAYTDAGWSGHIISKHLSYTGADNGYYLAVGSNSPAFFMNSMMWLATTERYNDGHWHQVAGTYDGATMSLYVDGVLKGSQVRGSPIANDMSITIGMATVGAATGAGYFTGKIDEVRVYGRSLSTAEVKSLFDSEAVSVPVTNCAAVPSDLIGWWPGDGNFLSQAGTNHAQPLGGASFGPGKVGQAFNFANDADRISIPHDPLFDVQAPGFTVEFWMRGSKNQPQSLYLVVDKSHGFLDNTGWYFQGDSARGQISFAIGGGGGGINFPSVTSTNDVLDGVFHHLAGTWDGTSTRLYVDGVLHGQTGLSGPASNTRPINLAYSWGGGSPQRFFRGQVDELSIYRRALSRNEILDIVAAGGAGKCGEILPPISLRLTVVRAENQIVISWPASAGNVVLQKADSLAAPIQWTTWSTAANVAGGQVSVTIPLTTGASVAAFYRALRTP